MKFVILVATSMLSGMLSGRAYAANLAIDDLIGHWCGQVSEYTFSRSRLDVERTDDKDLKHGSTLKIDHVAGTETEIDVYWVGLDNFTRFQLSKDKKELVQAAQQEGDKGPKRIFRRCGKQ